MSIQPTTRRNVIRSAAWVAPAVVVVSAAPAFAASTTGTLAVALGNTRYGPAPIDPELSPTTILFNGFTITPSISGNGPLTMVVTLGSGQPPFEDYPQTAPTGWSRVSAVGAKALTIQYVGGPLTAGVTIPFGPNGSDGSYFDEGGTTDSFTLTVQAPGFDSQSFGFAPPV